MGRFPPQNWKTCIPSYQRRKSLEICQLGGRTLKRVLITGGHGFIGRNLAEKLCDDYDLYLPSSEELDLLDQSAVADYLSQNRITHVIHTAVYNQRRRNISRDRELSANLHMFFTLAEHASELEKLIYLGSGAEYDKRRPIVMAEESAIGECLPLMNDYGLSKYLPGFLTTSTTCVCLECSAPMRTGVPVLFPICAAKPSTTSRSPFGGSAASIFSMWMIWWSRYAGCWRRSPASMITTCVRGSLSS